MRTVLGLGLAAACVFAGPRVWGQGGDARADVAGAPATVPAAAAEKVVVVADAFDDETENAKLRAKIYEALRGAGFAPESKLEVAPAAESAHAMQDGRVSTDDTALEGLRKGLGVSVLVRVARSDKGLLVVVVREGAAKSKVVVSTDDVPNVARELADATKLGKAPEKPAGVANASATTGNQSLTSGFILPSSKPEHEEAELTDPKALAAAWDARGGLRATYGVSVLLTGLTLPDVQYQGTNPDTGQVDTGKAAQYGIGAGVGVRLGMMYLPIPQAKSAGTSWAAFRLGVGLDVSGLYARSPKRYSYKLSNNQVSSRDTDYENVAYIYGVAPLELGVNFGFGDFRLPTLWRGLAFGLAYAPAYIFSLKVGEKENATKSQFNYAGFELSIDVAKLEAARGNQPQIRLSALVLPRVNNDLPWLTSLGIGAVWY